MAVRRSSQNLERLYPATPVGSVTGRLKHLINRYRLEVIIGSNHGFISKILIIIQHICVSDVKRGQNAKVEAKILEAEVTM